VRQELGSKKLFLFQKNTLLRDFERIAFAARFKSKKTADTIEKWIQYIYIYIYMYNIYRYTYISIYTDI